MAHQSGVVTQSLTQISERSNLNSLHDAAQIARIWMNMPNNTERPTHLSSRAREPSASDDIPCPSNTKSAEQLGETLPGPTPAGDRQPAADHTERAAVSRLNDQLQSCKLSPAAVDRNVYSQLQSPLFGELPAELRVQIWEYALTPETKIDRPTVAVALRETCRRAYDETRLMVYRQNQVRAHLLKSPLPGEKHHWTRLLSPEQQAATHLNLYVQPGASQAYGWNLLRWTKQLNFHPGTLQLTIWFTSGIGWWNHYVKDILKSVQSMRGIKTCILEFRTARDRFPEFDKHIQELQEKEIKLADHNVLAWDGNTPEYLEGSRIMMDNAFGRPSRLTEEEQPRWVPCRDPQQKGEREMLAIVMKWQSKSGANNGLPSS